MKPFLLLRALFLVHVLWRTHLLLMALVWDYRLGLSSPMAVLPLSLCNAPCLMFQDGVPLWDMLVGPINTVGPLLVDPAFPAAGLAVACAVGLLAVVAVTRQLWRSGRPPTPVRVGLDVGGMVLLVVGGLALLGARWHPVTTDGAPLPWTPVQTSAQELEANSENLGEIANLVGGDTGSKGGTETKAEADAEVARLVAESSAGAELPMWLAQAVLPLSFLLMALRFFGQFLFPFIREFIK